jgi:predicted phage terminase large subunit-like protein
LIDKDQQIVAAKRLIAIREARDKMLPFMKLTMPSPEAPADVEMSRYVETPQARILCKLIENMRNARKAGKRKRYAVSIGPQLGKSQVLSRAGPAWLSGCDPYCNVMLGTYNQTFAEEFGVDVRTIMESGAYGLVFPEHGLDKKAADHLITIKGGKLSFVGVGGSGSGKPADHFFVDDPIRNDEDAQSETYREKVWKWFTSVVFARLLNTSSAMVVHTRWNQDDLIGRLCDPDHPERNRKYAGIAEGWEYINLPAVIEDPELAEVLGLSLEVPTDPEIVKQFGTKPMSALWPGRKSLDFLAEAKKMDARVFGALYMGNPTPEDGDYFKRDHMLEYNADELPKELHKYGASDHAVGTKQQNDSTVLGCVGVDKNDDIWVLPDLEWDRMKTDSTVELMIALMKRHKPFMWWMESELISKSFGPFLQKRMNEEKCYTYVDPVTVAKNDKMMRARAIQGRMQGRKVHFPRFAPWWAEAKAQMLKFPYGAHDDFVDFMAHIGMGLMKEIKASGFEKIDKKIFRTGSPQWIIASSKEKFARDERLVANGGW